MHGSKDLQITFIDSELSLNDHFFTRWIMACSGIDTFGVKKQKFEKNGFVRTDSAKKEFLYGMPRLDFAIKFYKWPTFANKFEEDKKTKIRVELNFIYYFSGVFPTSIELARLEYNTTNAGSFSRPVTFAFDNMYVISDHTMAKVCRIK